MSAPLTTAGPQAVLAWLDREHPQVGHRVREAFAVFAGSPMPFDAHLRMLESLVDFGLPPAELQRMGRELADDVDRHVPGARLLLRFATPDRALALAPKLWAKHAGSGSLTVEKLGPGRARLTVTGLPSTDAQRAVVSGFLEGLLRKVGARSAQVAAVLGPAGACTFEGQWH